MYRDLLIAGAMKAGTTSLYRYLSQHPSVAPSIVKETHYYSDDLREHFAKRVVTEGDVVEAYEGDSAVWFHHARISSLSVYDSLFVGANERRIRMEASPSYLPSAVACARIAREATAPLVVVALRNPFERIVSHYEMNTNIGVYEEPLEHILRKELRGGLPLVRDGHVTMVRLSLYASDLARMIEAVGRDHVVVVRTEQLMLGVERVLGGICHKLGLPYRSGTLGEGVQHNQGKRRKEVVDPEPRVPSATKLLKRSGLLQSAKRALPVPAKSIISRLYYKQGTRGGSKDESSLRVVAPILNEDLERLSALLGEDYTGWAFRSTARWWWMGPSGRRSAEAR